LGLSASDVALQLTLAVLNEYKGFEFKGGKPEKLPPQEAAKAAAEIYAAIFRTVSSVHSEFDAQ